MGTKNPWPEKSDYGKRWRLGYAAGRSDTLQKLLPTIERLTTKGNSNAEHAIERLTTWASQHSDVAPLDSTDRNSPTFGDLRELLRLAKQPSKGSELLVADGTSSHPDNTGGPEPFKGIASARWSWVGW